MTTKAPDILTAALGHMQDRAETYDKPEGERSMPATVAAFNAATGRDLTAEEGWLFAIFLKAVRSQQGGYRADNYEDGAAYFALMGEQAACDRAHTATQWHDHFGDWTTVAVPKGSAAVLRHRDGTESQVCYVDPTGTHWGWLGKDEKPTDIVAYRRVYV